MIKILNMKKKCCRKKRGHRLLISFSLVLVAYSLFLSGCKEKVKPGSTEIKRRVVMDVVVMEVGPAQVDEYYETSGTIKAKTVSTIASRVMGTVTSLKVKEGDRVHSGQVLMTLDDSDISQKVKAAEAGYRESLKALEAAGQNKSLVDVTYRRYKNLHDEKAISQQEIDQVETQKKVADLEYERAQEVVNRAKAGLSEAKVVYGFTKITAPASGVVTEKKIETGSMAVPGTPLLTVEDPSSFRLELNADENLLRKLRSGMPVDVVVDSIGKNLKGRISEIVPAVDPVSRTFLIKVAVPGEGLSSGLYAKARMPLGTKEAIVLPATAIVEKGQLTGVYAVDERGIITYRLIRTGKYYDQGVEILSGINPKDKVITAGVDKAVDGGILGNGKSEQEAPPALQR